MRFPVGPATAATARAAIRDDLAAAPASVLNDAELLTSELVTNAVRHARLGPEDSVGVRVDLMPRTLRIGVSDRGPGFTKVSRPRDVNGGWGLNLVETVSDRWGVVRGRPNEVWFEIDL
jgi:anti-sigma regulatory factor (Ser/Thr protein kinase)